MRMTLGKAGWLVFALGGGGLHGAAQAQTTPPAATPYVVPMPTTNGVPASLRRTALQPAAPQAATALAPVPAKPLPAPMPVAAPVVAPPPPPSGPVADEPSPAIVRLMQNRQKLHPNGQLAGAEDRAHMVQTHVMLAWLADPATCRYPLKAYANGALLEVSGVVPNAQIKAHAVEVAERLGRMTVTDTVRVQPNATPPVPVVAPDQLQQHVHAALAQSGADRFTRDLHVQVHTSGHVSVTGAVPSLEHKLAVSQCVRGVPGCIAVDNQLSVRYFHFEGANYTLVSADGRYLMPGLAPASPSRAQVQEMDASRPRPVENLTQTAKTVLPGPAGREPVQPMVATKPAAPAPTVVENVKWKTAPTPTPPVVQAEQPKEEMPTLFSAISKRFKGHKEKDEQVVIISKPIPAPTPVVASNDKSKTTVTVPPAPTPVKTADLQLKQPPATTSKTGDAMAKSASLATKPTPTDAANKPLLPPTPGKPVMPSVVIPPVKTAGAQPEPSKSYTVPPPPVPMKTTAAQPLQPTHTPPAPRPATTQPATVASTPAPRPSSFGATTPVASASKDSTGTVQATASSGMMPKPMPAPKPMGVAPAPLPGVTPAFTAAPPVKNTMLASAPATTSVPAPLVVPVPTPAPKPVPVPPVVQSQPAPAPARSPYSMVQAKDMPRYDYPTRDAGASRVNTLAAAANSVPAREVTPVRHENVSRPAASTVVFQEKPAMASHSAVTSGVVVVASAEESPQAIPEVAQATLETWLKERVSLVCGADGRDLEVVLRSTTHLTVDLKTRDPQTAQQLSRKILAMQELEPYRVTLKVQAAQ